MLHAFFDGGAYPGGEIIGSIYTVIGDPDREQLRVTVSPQWFWITYWQGLIAWASIGVYVITAFGYQAHKSAQSGVQERSVRHLAGSVLAVIWLIFVIWNAIKIVI